MCVMLAGLRYLTGRYSFPPPGRLSARDPRIDPLLDLTLLRFILDSVTTPEEERILRLLRAARVPSVATDYLTTIPS